MQINNPYDSDTFKIPSDREPSALEWHSSVGFRGRTPNSRWRFWIQNGYAKRRMFAQYNAFNFSFTRLFGLFCISFDFDGKHLQVIQTVSSVLLIKLEKTLGYSTLSLPPGRRGKQTCNYKTDTIVSVTLFLAFSFSRFLPLSLSPSSRTNGSTWAHSVGTGTLIDFLKL